MLNQILSSNQKPGKRRKETSLPWHKTKEQKGKEGQACNLRAHFLPRRGGISGRKSSRHEKTAEDYGEKRKKRRRNYETRECFTPKVVSGVFLQERTKVDKEKYGIRGN